MNNEYVEFLYDIIRKQEHQIKQQKEEIQQLVKTADILINLNIQQPQMMAVISLMASKQTELEN